MIHNTIYSSVHHNGQRNKKRINLYVLERLKGYLLILPAIILIIIFKGYPLINGFIMSLQKAKPDNALEKIFIGLENYKYALNDEIFKTSLINISKSISFLPILVLTPLIIAYLINQRVYGWKFFRGTYLLTYLLSPVMIGFIFRYILSKDGPLNSFLKLIGLEQFAIPWLGNTFFVMYMIMVVLLWNLFGFGTLIYLASMATIGKDLAEAARLDGANDFHILIHIIIPHVLPTIGYWTVLCTASIFIGVFPLIFTLTEGGPGYASMTLEYYIYLTATKFANPYYSSALGIILFLFILIISLIQVRFMYKD